MSCKTKLRQTQDFEKYFATTTEQEDEYELMKKSITGMIVHGAKKSGFKRSPEMTIWSSVAKGFKTSLFVQLMIY